MTREYKFRGLNANKEWGYGLISKDTEGSTAYYTDIPYRICWFEDSAHCNQPVITESIGQYTGLKDRNGVEIYEGDVVRTDYGKVGEVVYHATRASYIIHDKDHFNEKLCDSPVEVIGDAYSNPDLLK